LMLPGGGIHVVPRLGLFGGRRQSRVPRPYRRRASGRHWRTLGGIRSFLSAEKRRWRRHQGRSQLRQRRRPRHFFRLLDYCRGRFFFGKFPAEIGKDRAMRAHAPLAFLCAIGAFATAARAETEVKAEDCSAAVSGTMIGARVEVHCLSKEDIARVVDELVRKGVVRRAEEAGIESQVIVSLAARLRPGEKLDLAQAVVEVS